MVVLSGPARVVESGQVTTFGGNGLKLLLELPEDNFLVELEFLEGADGVTKVTSEQTGVGIRLLCTNFDDASGRGSALPVLLAALDDELVFFHFRVFRFGDTIDRTVHYTFYRADKEQVGWQEP